jgi:glycosyltransferase involved in cell wall biosynthesis
MTQPLVTVAICTWNRHALLRRTLESLALMTVPADLTWELLVCDNMSTDATPAVLDDFAGRLPLRRCVATPRGLSHARNAVVESAYGRYLVWTDDDVCVTPGWLAAYAAAFRRWPDAAVFGGPVLPSFEGTPPAWLAASIGQLGDAFAIRDFGPEPFPLEQRRLPFGANMAVRIEEQRRFRYHPRLGRRGRQMRSGEETAVLAAIIAEGATGWWVPETALHHMIPRSRQTTAYLRAYYQGKGETEVVLGAVAGHRFIAGRPLWVWRSAVVAEMQYRVHRAFSPPRVWLRYLQKAAMSQGMLRLPSERPPGA